MMPVIAAAASTVAYTPSSGAPSLPRRGGVWQRGTCRILLLGLALGLGSDLVAAAPTPTDPAAVALADCRADAHARPLAPDARVSAAWASLPAQAAWLDRHRVRVAPQGDVRVARWVVAQGDALAQRAAVGEALPVDLQVHPMAPAPAPSPDAAAWRATSALGGQQVLAMVEPLDAPALRMFHRGAHALVGLDAQDRVLVMSRIQSALALDDLYAAAESADDLGVSLIRRPTAVRWALWAPTARAVWVCAQDARGRVEALAATQSAEDAAAGLWRVQAQGARWRSGLYTYLVDVFVPSVGWVRNRVTDPYSVSLSADSRQSWIGSLDDPASMPQGWRGHRRPSAPSSAVDMMIVELHVRDFSASDDSVAPTLRGTYRAFTDTASRGMRHLAAMARAGLRDVHLLPIFDLATVPERGCVRPDEAALRAAPPDGEQQQALVEATAARDCFNWGYDPFHFNAPEGSFATDAQDPVARIRELRQMVMALHRLGLRVGMDVVYNHMSASGQHPQSVLDRIVPGYYHRLDARGQVERSTCCDNTATEHRMMRKLMIDSAVLWVRHHGIDSFRFDLMGHQPREAMEALQQAVDRAAGRRIPLIGEGWNFGEVADGARFTQASQLSLNGSGIGTFNDRLRDAARGTRHGDDPATTVARKGWLNGALGADQARQADIIRAGLAGSVRSMPLHLHDGRHVTAQAFVDGGQPVGYVSEPSEAVNYVENHDNPTLFDLNAFKLPPNADAWERARVQVLGSALVALGQGVPYWHAGQEILRSKSLDLNSYDSGDWFNRLDWSLQDNGFGAGVPPGADSRPFWPLMKPLLAQASIKPGPEVIRFSLQAHLDLLRLRASTPLLRLPTTRDIVERLSFPNSGPQQNPAVIVMRIDGRGSAGSPHAEVLVVFNAARQSQTLALPELAGRRYELHPVHRGRLAAETRWNAEGGEVTVPALSAVVWVVPGSP